VRERNLQKTFVESRKHRLKGVYRPQNNCENGKDIKMAIVG
jgi:hypothetical protein